MRAIAQLFALACLLSITASAKEQAARELVLEVWLNGRPRHVDIHVAERDGGLWIERKDLQAIGLTGDDDTKKGDFVDLKQMTGVEAAIEETDQTLRLSTVQARILPAVFDLGLADAPREATTAATGIAADYRLVATASNIASSRQAVALGASLSVTAFTTLGTFSTTGFGRLEQGDDRAVRLDSAWTIDDPSRLRRVTIGDTISGGLSWSRPVRMGGVQIASDFSLQPDLVTIPLPDFFGQAAVPGSLDVFVGASKVFSGDLEPGPFEVHDLPVISGTGQATIVVRDLLGRQTVQALSLFTSNQMLAEGLTSYSIDAGFVREAYGENSFAYGTPVAEATIRHGLRDWLTLEAHSEVSSDVVNGGLGAIVPLSHYGTVQLAGAASSSDDGAGALGSLAVQFQFDTVGLYAVLEATTPQFLDIGGHERDGDGPARQTLQLGASLDLGGDGVLGAAFVSVDRDDEDRTSLATASYTLSLGSGLTFGITGQYNAEDNTFAAETFLSVPLGGGPSVSASVRSETNGATEGRLALEHPADPDGGLGYRLSVAQGTATTVDAEARWQGQQTSLNARVAAGGGNLAMQVEAEGAVVVVDDAAYLTRRTDGAFALVETGQEDARIYRENREVAKTDAEGRALLTGLVPFTRNRIAIEPSDYDMSRTLDRTEHEVVPGRGGVIVDFTPAARNAALVVVTLPDGKFPVAGSAVRFGDGDQPWVVGHRGSIFIADLHAPLKGIVETRDGPCSFEIAKMPDPVKGDIIHLDPISCTMEF